MTRPARGGEKVVARPMQSVQEFNDSTSGIHVGLCECERERRAAVTLSNRDLGYV